MTEWRWPGAAVFERYAAAVGKDADALTQAERGLAVANWALEMTEGTMTPSEKFAALLMDLIDLQDSITHMQGKGPEYEVHTRHLIERRLAKHREIVEYVAGLEALKKELVAACEAIVAYTTRGEGAGWRVTEMAEAAIAKARGE